MTDSVNPYSPPQASAPPQSWWSRMISALFTSTNQLSSVQRPTFAKGGAIICGGIAYFIDPLDSKTLFAGSPSTDRSDKRFALIAHEAMQHLPDFLAAHGDGKPTVNDRRLVVRIVNDYSGIFSDYARAVEVLPSPISLSLAAHANQADG